MAESAFTGRNGELAPVFVAGATVDRPAPAAVFPRGRAGVNALRRQGGSLLGQFLPVEVHAPFFDLLAVEFQPRWAGNVSQSSFRLDIWTNSSSSGPFKNGLSSIHPPGEPGTRVVRSLGLI